MARPGKEKRSSSTTGVSGAPALLKSSLGWAAGNHRSASGGRAVQVLNFAFTACNTSPTQIFFLDVLFGGGFMGYLSLGVHGMLRCRLLSPAMDQPPN